ncbi:MAG TPA: sigma-70 family RNA polymerase sigma factor [Baekduia sp.]|nr:sigma-70 family RNA polymerase sigma factor [Baekduia sp.]
MRDRDLERLFAEHAAPLHGYLAYRTGDATLADDLLGDVFERLVRAKRRFDPRKGSEKAWIYAIALNCLRDHARRTQAEDRAVQRVAAGTGLEIPPAEQQVEDADLVARALRVLSPPEQEVVALRYGADLRLADIARVIGEPEATARGRLYRALHKLQAEVA